jgi:hypothetical protein
MNELLNGKSIKADFEAQVTAAHMVQSRKDKVKTLNRAVKIAEKHTGFERGGLPYTAVRS